MDCNNPKTWPARRVMRFSEMLLLLLILTPKSLTPPRSRFSICMTIHKHGLPLFMHRVVLAGINNKKIKKKSRVFDELALLRKERTAA